MATYEFYIYSNTVLGYNSGTNAFDFDPDYAHWDGRYRVVVNDDDSTFNSTGDGNQTATVFDMDGNVVQSGLLTTPFFGELDDGSGGLIMIDRIEVDGNHVGYVTDVALTPGASYPYVGGGTWSGAYSYYEANSVPCFAPETPIATESGQIPVSDLCAGDMVLTRDNGFQPVLWAGRWRVPPQVLADDPRHWPVVIDAALPGAGCPAGALRLSSQHQVMLRDPWFDLTAGSTEVLALAGALGTPRRPAPGEEVVWHHLLLARHEIIQAAGLWVESLFSGGALFAALPPILRIAATAALGDTGPHRETARPCLRRWEAELFLRRHGRPAGQRAARVA